MLEQRVSNPESYHLSLLCPSPALGHTAGGYFLRAYVCSAPCRVLGYRSELDLGFLPPQSPQFREKRLKTNHTNKRIIKMIISENPKCHEVTNTG